MPLDIKEASGGRYYFKTGASLASDCVGLEVSFKGRHQSPEGKIHFVQILLLEDFQIRILIYGHFEK